MNKANLKASWGAYCNTDKLVDDLMTLFTKYGHRNSEHGVCKMLDTYFTNKKDLIDLLQKSPHYIGDMRVCIDEEMERYANKQEVYNFCANFVKNVGAEKILIERKDEDGKTLNDYLKTGIEHVSAKDFMTKNSSKMQILKLNNENRNRFNDKGETVKSRKRFENAYNQILRLKNNYTSTLDAETANNVNKIEDCKLVSGMKTARAFNRVCTHYGIDKCADYNKLFAQYADMVSGLKRKIKFFISANPIDYLTMSVGVNWTSCHHIRTGGYKGGCMSYMLDSTSLITFVHDHVPTDWTDGKIYRCMFHYGNNLLVQSRVYPQGNDGNTDLYSVFRGFVQIELATMLGANNEWKRLASGTKHIDSFGVHYKDYLYNSGCNVTFLKENEPCNINRITIGHVGICPYCGEEFTGSSSRFSHSNCVIPSGYSHYYNTGSFNF